MHMIFTYQGEREASPDAEALRCGPREILRKLLVLNACLDQTLNASAGKSGDQTRSDNSTESSNRTGRRDKEQAECLQRR
jgi:hypothetical protein